MKISIKHMALAGLLLCAPQLMHAAAAPDKATIQLRALEFPVEASQWFPADLAKCYQSLEDYHKILVLWSIGHAAEPAYKEILNLSLFLIRITQTSEIAVRKVDEHAIADGDHRFKLLEALGIICEEAKFILIEWLKEKNDDGKCKLEQFKDKIAAGEAVEFPHYNTERLNAGLAKAFEVLRPYLS